MFQNDSPGHYVKSELKEGQWWQGELLGSNQVRGNDGLDYGASSRGGGEMYPGCTLKEQVAGQVMEYERQTGIKNKDYSEDFDVNS